MERIICRNPLTYEEILNWRGFSFEQSRVISESPISKIGGLLNEVEDGTYGIEESDRIINNVVNKQKGY